MRTRSLAALIRVAAAVVVFSGFFAGCAPKAAEELSLKTIFDEGRTVFFKTVADAVEAHPDRGRLTAGELAKAKNLEGAYPRLYAILMNYYYCKDEPAFTALIHEGGRESLERFRSMYLDLAGYVGRTFVKCVLSPGAHSLYFKDLNPRFKGKDTIDIVALSAGCTAKLEVPPPPDKPRSLSPEFDKQWGLDAARFRAAHGITRGKGVNVAVLDSGIDATHPIFASTEFGRHRNFIGRYGFPWDAEERPMVDYGCHGTEVSSIVARYAPEARITVYRYMDSDTMNDAIYPIIATDLMGAAIYKAVHDGNDVINISAGSLLAGDFIRDACQYAYDNNVIIVTASPYYLGRYFGQNDVFPGHYPTNIAVTGIAKLGEDKYGYWDAAAPDAATAVGAPNDPFIANPYYSGLEDEYGPAISCATPVAASLVALIASAYPRLGTEAPGRYVEAVRKLLTENADSRIVGFDGFSPDCGYGMIDAEKSVKAARKRHEERRTPAAAASASVPAAAAAEDEAFARGRAVFHKELGAALGLHPEKYRLLRSEIERLEGGTEGLPGLYEAAVRVLFPKDGPALLEIRGRDEAAFRAAYFKLCREAADRFVESLFTERAGVEELLRSSGDLGRGRLELVLESLGLGAAGEPDMLKTALSRPGDGRAFAACGFPKALASGRGRGRELAVIDSGCAFGSELVKGVHFNHAFDRSLVGGTQAPWSGEGPTVADDLGRGTLLASIAAACAPESELRVYRIRIDPASPFEYWPAMQLAQAIYQAARDGCDIIVTGAAFSRDFPFLQQACQWAYFRNVAIVAPNGTVSAAGQASPAYPAGYNMVLAAAGVLPDKNGRPATWALSLPSKLTIAAAPAIFAPEIAPSNAFAAAWVGGLAALVSARVPRTGKEYPGQQVQRIMEILKKSADPAALGFRAFDPRIGYGLIDAAKSVGPGAEAFIEKMKATDEHFAKRMAERAKEIEEAARQAAAATKK